MSKYKFNRKVTKKDIIILLLFVIAIIVFFVIKHILFVIENKKYDYVGKDVYLTLEARAATNEKAAYIFNNMESYPKELLIMYYNDEKYLNFVYDYPEKGMANNEIVYSLKELSADVPMLLQYDERWGYKSMGREPGEMIAQGGCLVTSLTMSYIGLTGKTDVNPKELADLFDDNNLLGISGTLAKAVPWFCKQYGLGCTEYVYKENQVPEKEVMTNALSSGHILISAVKDGDFVAGNCHAIVIRKYQNGYFYVNDPASIANSGKSWSYDVIAPQIIQLWDIYYDNTSENLYLNN